MPRTIGDIIKVAETHKHSRDWIKALKIFRLIMEAAPYDSEIRLDISRAFMALGFEQEALQGFVESCKYCSRAGYPLQAIVAAKKVAQVKGNLDEMYNFIAGLYAAESENKGKTSRIAPIDQELPVKEDVNLDYPIDTRELVHSTLALVMAASQTARYPETLPPIPILSDLPSELFVRFLKEVKLISAEPGTIVIREGELATNFFMIARGKVAIYKGEGPNRRIELARLGEGSIFGEMALITQSPRTATVEATDDVELLDFGKEKLDVLSEDSVVIEAALERFTRERLISNLLATNPIFQPFSRKQRYQLLSRFTAHEVTPGTVLVREGQVGRGLYIILYGQADVAKKENGANVLVAALRSGDIFGEISLIRESETTATVTATTHCTILFLPKEYFQKLTESIGDLKDYFDKLTEARLTMTEKAIRKAKELEEEAIVLEDEMIMI
jgi:CRP-like cAMP-binding protein